MIFNKTQGVVSNKQTKIVNMPIIKDRQLIKPNQLKQSNLEQNNLKQINRGFKWKLK